MISSTVALWLSGAALKGTLLIIIVALVQWIGRDRIPPGWRFALWMVVVVRLLLPAAPESPLSIFNLASSQSVLNDGPGTPTLSARSTSGPAVVLTPLPRHSPRQQEVPSVLLQIWGAGFLLLAARAAFASLRFHRRLREEILSGGVSEPQPAVVELLDASRAFMGIKRRVQLCQTELVASPALHGIVHPRLLIPKSLAQSFLPDDFRYVFLHELAHLRRRDIVLNWTLAVAECVHWFNPLVWIAVARMREERELACDALALGRLRLDERPRYGQTILKLLDCFRSPVGVPALVGIANHKSQMKRRIIMIAGFKKSRLTGLFAVLVLALGVVSLTDAQTRQRSLRRVEAPSPETAAVSQKLNVKVSLKLENASILEVLNAVSGRTNVNITLSPEVATQVSSLPTLSIEANEIPAHILAQESLSAVGLELRMKADSAEVVKSTGQKRMLIANTGSDQGTFPGDEVANAIPYDPQQARRVLASLGLVDTMAPDADGAPRRVMIERREVRHPGDAPVAGEGDQDAPEALAEAEAIVDLPAPAAGERVIVIHRNKAIHDGAEGAVEEGTAGGITEGMGEGMHQKLTTRFVDENGAKSSLIIEVNQKKPAQ